jgi:hypothetical protein
VEEMERVMLIGCGGAGKSTLARELGKRLGLPVYHLDALFWRPGWVPTPREEWRGIQSQLVQQERWIIDGNYDSTLEIRLARADSVIFRPDLNPGCPEKIDRDFLRWIWAFPRETRPELLRKLQGVPPTTRVIHLRSRREVAEFLANTKGPNER